MDLTNTTPFAVATMFSRNLAGQECVLVCISGRFEWGEGLKLNPVENQEVPTSVDHFTDDDSSKSMWKGAEVSPPKPNVDIYVCGSIRLAEPKPSVDCSLVVGGLLHKVVRVWGPRVWRKSGDKMLQSAPEAFLTMPVQWERAFGGVYSADVTRHDKNNPVGIGWYEPKDADNRPLPNFESPTAPPVLGVPSIPTCFGAIAPHWGMRAQYAGTYDESWQRQRAPLLPADFDDRFYNIAPIDQQLDRYPVGETITLVNMTPRGHESFLLPEFTFPVAFVDAGQLVEREAHPDTVFFDLDTRQVTIRAAVEYLPKDSVLDLAAAFVGEMGGGRRKALLQGKTYLDWHEARKGVRP